MTDPTLTPQRGLWSRRKKLIASGAAGVATAAVGFVVPQVLGTVQSRVAPPAALHAQVLTDVAKFRSDAPHIPLFVVPRPIARIGRPPDANDDTSRAAPLRYAWAHEQAASTPGRPSPA
jgi:hypothetical protein